eukprot:m.165956 g.165956  ORF g.165956 m.165956 type:complete len:232 (-) comp16608_c0_seq5:91-786(-)
MGDFTAFRVYEYSSDRFDINGYLVGFPFPADFFVLHVQGAAMLKKGDVIAPKVFSSKDKDYIVNKQCQFSAVRLNTTYGFSADFVADVNIARKKVAQVTGAWRTNVTAGLFDKGNVFDEAAGMFTAPVDGWYYASANVRIDGVSTASYIEVSIKSSLDTTTKDHGLYAIQAPIKGGQRSPAQNTLNPAGVTYMTKGATLSIWTRIQASSGTPRIQSTTGFSVVLLFEDASS